MNVNITKASKMANVSRNTIYKDIEEGRLTSTTNGRGKKLINVAELQRVYEDVSNDINARPKKLSSDVQKRPERSIEESTSNLLQRIESLKKENELYEIRLKERDTAFEDYKTQTEERISDFKNQATRLTALLEDKREGQGDKFGELLELVKSQKEEMPRLIEEGIQRKFEERKRLAKERAEAMRAAEEKRKAIEEQNKGFWRRLFAR